MSKRHSAEDMGNGIEEKSVPPEVIYLQVGEGSNEYEDEGVTWCRDKINDSDLEYIRKDILEPIGESIEAEQTICAHDPKPVEGQTVKICTKCGKEEERI